MAKSTNGNSGGQQTNKSQAETASEKQSANQPKASSEKKAAAATTASRPRVRADVCPRNPLHTHTRVYKTQGRVRYCKCNDCGHTWQLTGAHADGLKDYAERLATALDDAERQESDGQYVAVFADDALREIASDLRRLVAESD